MEGCWRKDEGWRDFRQWLKRVRDEDWRDVGGWLERERDRLEGDWREWGMEGCWRAA
jgi:hypothetical protein